MPQESVADLHEHTQAHIDEFTLVRRGDLDILNSCPELWKILLDNKVSILLRDEKMCKLIDGPMSEGPWHDEREDG